MPQTIKLKINASVGQVIFGNEAPLEIANYAPFEETICRCQTGVIELPLGDVSRIGMIVIAADKYANEKDCVPSNGKASCKCVRFKFEEAELSAPVQPPPDLTADAAKCATSSDPKSAWNELPSAQMIPGFCIGLVVPPNTKRLCVHNPLATDIKVSVLATRKPVCQCAAPTSPTAA
jgi:hypothetical protein